MFLEHNAFLEMFSKHHLELLQLAIRTVAFQIIMSAGWMHWMINGWSIKELHALAFPYFNVWIVRCSHPMVHLHAAAVLSTCLIRGNS